MTNAEYGQIGDLMQAGLQTVNSLDERLHRRLVRRAFVNPGQTP